MSDKSTIYEITQLMNNKETLQNDLNEAVNTVKDIFYKKYIQKFQNALDEHRNLSEKQSSKEIQLLKALKPFVTATSHSSIDSVISVMNTLNTAKSIDKEIKQCSATFVADENIVNTAAVTTIHDDGIYEIDETCQIGNFSNNPINITEIIFMLLLTGILS